MNMSGASIASTGSGSDQQVSAGVRLVVLNLPEDEGAGLGFRVTRTLWDPYPWVREVTAGARADAAGLRVGDCLLQADGRDLLGLPVSQVAGLIRGDGAGRGVSLMVWNCGVDPRDDPELLWSCGGGARGERSRRALAGVVKALACCVCAATATRALSCARSHLYCEACWIRLERCALCREVLPAKDSPYARNLVAEQVFEAIALEYEIKETMKKPTQTVSAYSSPSRSPVMSPATSRKGNYQLSMMNKRKTVQFNEKFGPNYASDPNIHSSSSQNRQELPITRNLPTLQPNSTNLVETSCKDNSNSDAENSNKTECCCQKLRKSQEIQKNPAAESSKCTKTLEHAATNCQNVLFQHKLVTRLRPACSLVDLEKSSIQACALSRSLNNISLGLSCHGGDHHTGSLDDLKNNNSSAACETPVLLLSPPPIYLLQCEHSA